jgi:hypothetical protein
MAYDSTGIQYEQPRYVQVYAQAESDVRSMQEVMLEGSTQRTAMNQRQSSGASPYPSPTGRGHNKQRAVGVLRFFHFSAQANIPQDTHDAFTLGLLAEIDRGSAVVIHRRHSMLPALLTFGGRGDAFLLDFELQLLHQAVVRLLTDDIVELRAVIID